MVRGSSATTRFQLMLSQSLSDRVVANVHVFVGDTEWYKYSYPMFVARHLHDESRNCGVFFLGGEGKTASPSFGRSIPCAP